MTSPPSLVAVAHGTRAPDGPAVLGELLEQVRERLPRVVVRISYVDVIGPALGEVLRELDGPAVVVPMFLASGYHVQVDVPEAVAVAGRSGLVTPAVGADSRMVAATAARLRSVAVGRPFPDAVVLAAAGSSVPGALDEVEAAARWLACHVEREVLAAYVTTARPSVAAAVSELRSRGHATVAIAPYLLAPGLFQRRLADVGADIVADPIGAHPLVADVIVERYQTAASALAS